MFCCHLMSVFSICPCGCFVYLLLLTLWHCVNNHFTHSLWLGALGQCQIGLLGDPPNTGSYSSFSAFRNSLFFFFPHCDRIPSSWQCFNLKQSSWWNHLCDSGLTWTYNRLCFCTLSFILQMLTFGWTRYGSSAWSVQRSYFYVRFMNETHNVWSWLFQI